MNHVGDSANLVNSVEHINRFGGVGHTYCNVVAFLCTEGLESGGYFVDFFDEFFVGNLGIEILQGRVVWPFTG